MGELVWCVPRDKWEEKCKFEGFNPDSEGNIYRFLLENGEFRDRDEAEKDYRYKQVIPQGLLINGKAVYVNQRLPKQSETRLLYAYSLGVGGHLNPEDNLIPHMDLIQLGLHREMAEEVKMQVPFSPRYIGITNDEQAEVSQLHVGVWFEITLLSKEVEVKETEKLRGFWEEIDQLGSVSPDFESWAGMIYKHYLKQQNNLKSEVEVGAV